MKKKLRGGYSCGKARYQLHATPIRVHCGEREDDAFW